MLVRPHLIARVLYDQPTGYLVIHADGSRVHVPHNPERPDFHRVQDYLRGVRLAHDGSLYMHSEEPPPEPPRQWPQALLPVTKAMRALRDEIAKALKRAGELVSRETRRVRGWIAWLDERPEIAQPGVLAGGIAILTLGLFVVGIVSAHAQTYTLTLEKDEVVYLSKILGKQPIEEGVGLYLKLHNEVAAQDNARAAKIAPSKAPDASVSPPSPPQ